MKHSIVLTQTVCFLLTVKVLSNKMWHSLYQDFDYGQPHSAFLLKSLNYQPYRYYYSREGKGPKQATENNTSLPVCGSLESLYDSSTFY